MFTLSPCRGELRPSEFRRANLSTPEAARRVLLDLGQVLASFADCLVVVGGWTPDLLLPDADAPQGAASMSTSRWMPPS